MAGFRRTLKPTFSAPVVVKIPDDSGKLEANEFTAVFKRVSSSEREDLAALPHAELLRKVLVGWEMKDKDTGEDVPFNKAELDAALEITQFPMATAIAFWESLNGARSKN